MLLRQRQWPIRRSFHTALTLRRGRKKTPDPLPSTASTPELPTTAPTAPSASLVGLITPGSSQHHDLTSFLSHAHSTGLSPTSTVYRGTHYEYTVADSLRRLGFDLVRTGRASDLGIDLLGTWTVPSHPVPLRVLVQCKNQSRIGPEMVRGLEGAFVGAPARFRGEGVMGLLASAVKATRGVREALQRSSLPLAFLMVKAQGTVGQFLWNQEAERRGLSGLGVTLRYMQGDEEQALEVQHDVALTWKGNIIEDSIA